MRPIVVRGSLELWEGARADGRLPAGRRRRHVCRLPADGLIDLELGLCLGTGGIPGRGLIELGLPQRRAARGGKGWRCGRLADMGKEVPNRRRLGEEGDQTHLGAAVWTV